MQPIPLVSAWNLLPFTGFLEGIGAPVERWLADSRISPNILETPGRALPLQLCLDFLERAARAEGADSIGLDVGRQAAAESFGRVGALLRRCSTLYARISLSCRLMSSLNNYSSMWLEPDGDDVKLHARAHCERDPRFRHAEDFTLMLFLEAIERAAEPGWKPRAICLPGIRTQRFAREELFQGVSMVYGSPDMVVVFSARLLSRALRELPLHLRGRPRAAARPDGNALAADFVGSLEDMVAALLPCGCPSTCDLAEMAHMSPRTLQRRVAEEGSSLRQVIENARFRLATEYLRGSDATVTDIALELGYGDSTAFTRAFRRMAGVPPSRYRHPRADA